MAAVQQLCLYYKTGFCKYRDHCKNKHVEEICEVSSCTGDNCSKRHPKMCKFYLSLGQCKFSDSCKYSHDNQLCKDVCSVKQEIMDLQSRLHKLEAELAALKNTKSLESQHRTKVMDNSSLLQSKSKKLSQQSSPFTPPGGRSVKPRTCETCSLSYPTEEDFRRHDSLQFCCELCGICFPTKKDVKIHEEEFHPGIFSANYLRKKNGFS